MTALVERVGRWTGTPLGRTLMSFLPQKLPGVKKVAPPQVAWPEWNRQVPPDLLRQPGIRRDVAEEDRSFAAGPLPKWTVKYEAAATFFYQHTWRSLLPVAPQYWRGTQRMIRSRAAVDRRALLRTDAPLKTVLTTPERENLTRGLEKAAADAGVSAIGIAPMDNRYVNLEHQAEDLGDYVIICLVERNYDATQDFPSPTAERASLAANALAMQVAHKLYRYLTEQGFDTKPFNPDGFGISHHFAVEAGLGQLGINGQLLSPFAGSRCSIVPLTTHAPLIPGAPRDFGIDGVCDNCRICSRRCPVGAIPAKKEMHRGVYKAKLEMSKCLPVVSQAHGCAICMKVCPIQKFGLHRVLDHWEETGNILGKRTDALEGYEWPLDGKYYGSGARPPMPDPDFFVVPGVDPPAFKG